VHTGDAFGVVESPFCCDSSGCVVGAGVLAFGHHRAALAGGFCCPDTWC